MCNYQVPYIHTWLSVIESPMAIARSHYLACCTKKAFVLQVYYTRATDMNANHEDDYCLHVCVRSVQ